MIDITKPFLPPLPEFQEYVKQIWERNWLTNNGPLVNELELRLKQYLRVNHLLYLNNGTIALQLALKALEIRGEVITTPFSYIATTSFILWEGCKPVFADIDPATLNIDPDNIEALITEKTSAIVATHTFGNPCDIDRIQMIAYKYNLKVIYDAAHCFGTRYKGSSVYAFGDISTASFHATKIFHTIEGGAVFSRDSDLIKKMAQMRNFGHNGPYQFGDIGINGKNSEFHAAMGLVNLKYIDEVAVNRKKQHDRYNSWLEYMNVRTPVLNPFSESNHSYYPVIFESEAILLKVVEMLNGHWIYPRRYFYPSLNTLNYFTNTSCPVSEDISTKILCLPSYHNLSMEAIDFICRLILRVQNN